MRTLPAALALLAVLVFGAACGDDGSGPDEDGIHGTYTLRSVDLTNLPFTISNNSTRKVEVTAGEIVLRADGTFKDELVYRVTPVGGTESSEGDVLNGTFTRALEILTLTPSGELQGYSVTVLENGNLMQTIGAYTLVYAR
jgi:hypothetical protein